MLPGIQSGSAVPSISGDEARQPPEGVRMPTGETWENPIASVHSRFTWSSDTPPASPKKRNVGVALLTQMTGETALPPAPICSASLFVDPLNASAASLVVTDAPLVDQPSVPVRKSLPGTSV